MFDLWIYKMAWRDSRGSRKHLLLFLSSMVLGVAALVAIHSFGENMEFSVDQQAKTLLGADLNFSSNSPFSPEVEALIDSIGGQQSRRLSFSSMAYFPKTNRTRLSTIRADEGGFPYYGDVVTSPEEASTTYIRGRYALVDGTLANQFDVQLDDSVRVGEIYYRIVGILKKMPRESQAVSLFSPRIYIPEAYVDTTLFGPGSRVDYEVFFRLDEGEDVEALARGLRPRLRAQQVGVDTVEEVKEEWDEGLTNLYKFLSLVGFVALLLGAIGVASAVHVYIKQRIDTVAVLRCMGATSNRTFGVYLVQAAAMGLIGGLIGCMIGIGVQTLLPGILVEVLPIEVYFFISWEAVFWGLGLGLGVTLLFALLPLLSVRNISPLLTLRSLYESDEKSKHSVLQWLVYLLISLAITVFAILQAPDWPTGLGYAASIAIVFGMLGLVARLIIKLTQKFFPTTWTYPWRQGLANLYRPHNQTGILMVSLGLGTFLIMTLYLAHSVLLQQIEVAGDEGLPNIVFFDIQSDQIDGVSSLVKEQQMPVLDQVPIVTMRVQAVKGRTVEEMRADSTTRVSWAYRREYRSSYRDYLTESEQIIDGTFVATMPVGSDVAPVSLEQEIADELDVSIGDSIVFDVQGVPISTVVSSIRAVEWRRISTNFFVIFPTGILEEAPQFFVLLSRSDDEMAAATLQSAVIRAFPNISAIDLSLVLNTFDEIFGRISFVVRFMALFSILTGIIVLVGAVVVSRYQRMEESVLLKTLGASRSQIIRIMLIEYLFLGFFASMTGLSLSLGAGWALALFVFESAFVPPLLPLLGAVLAVTGLTIMIGMINSRGIYDRPPLEVLRAEV